MNFLLQSIKLFLLPLSNDNLFFLNFNKGIFIYEYTIWK